jgi:Flp pilus assembly pilin Flp
MHEILVPILGPMTIVFLVVIVLGIYRRGKICRSTEAKIRSFARDTRGTSLVECALTIMFLSVAIAAFSPIWWPYAKNLANTVTPIFDLAVKNPELTIIFILVVLAIIVDQVQYHKRQNTRS